MSGMRVVGRNSNDDKLVIIYQTNPNGLYPARAGPGIFAAEMPTGDSRLPDREVVEWTELVAYKDISAQLPLSHTDHRSCHASRYHLD
jgi:hypothetical protein